MSNLLQQWQELWADENGGKEIQARIESYYASEKEAYDYILKNNQNTWHGSISALAKEFGFADDTVIFVGFLEGMQTSLQSEIDLDNLDNDSEVGFELDFEKLYENMHVAKADWLYNLESWDGVLTPERRLEIVKAYRKTQIASVEKVGRNEKCPCGSGKKYKQCCGKGA